MAGRKEKEKKNKKGINKPEVYGANNNMVTQKFKIKPKKKKVKRVQKKKTVKSAKKTKKGRKKK